jgi:hypothetical protein
MRQSELQFIRQQGFATAAPDHRLYVALMFQPRVVTAAVAVGIILQSAWVFLALSIALWWGTIVPTGNLFDAAYNLLIASPRRLSPIPNAPAPRRFAQAMAGTMALAVGGSLLSGVTTAAWVLEALFALATLSVVVGRICAPAGLYQRLAGSGQTPLVQR